jgi:hypothetical protein
MSGQTDLSIPVDPECHALPKPHSSRKTKDSAPSSRASVRSGADVLRLLGLKRVSTVAEEQAAQTEEQAGVCFFQLRKNGSTLPGNSTNLPPAA